MKSSLMTKASQLPFGWVCFSNKVRLNGLRRITGESQLPFGWVCFSNNEQRSDRKSNRRCLNCLSAGSVSLTRAAFARTAREITVSIAFRLGLFL